MPVIFLLAAGFPYWFANLRPSRCRQGRSPQKSGDFPCLSKAACSRREGICKRVCLADERPLIKLCLQTETLRAPAQPGQRSAWYVASTHKAHLSRFSAAKYFASLAVRYLPPLPAMKWGAGFSPLHPSEMAVPVSAVPTPAHAVNRNAQRHAGKDAC